MTELTVRFIANHTIISQAIRSVTNSSASHAEPLVNGKWVSAMPPRITLQDMNYATELSWERRYTLDVPDEAAQKANDWILSQVGKPYNRLDIAGLLFHQKDWTNPSEFICSQLTFLYLVQAGLQPLNVLPDYAHLVTPEMLHLSPLFIGRLTKAVG